MDTAATLGKVLPHLAEELAAVWSAALDGAWREFGVETEGEKEMFLAQALHETSGLSRLSENLNYSAKGLLSTWPHRFNPAMAEQYAHRPFQIAEHVYGGRFGNRPEGSGDGWRYRGRGLFHTTFIDNYRRQGEVINLPLVEHPELLEQPLPAARSAGAYWRDRHINIVARAGDFDGVTHAVAGSLTGALLRQEWWVRVKAAVAAG